LPTPWFEIKGCKLSALISYRVNPFQFNPDIVQTVFYEVEDMIVQNSPGFHLIFKIVDKMISVKPIEAVFACLPRESHKIFRKQVVRPYNSPLE
jgi:hypothetical protein